MLEGAVPTLGFTISWIAVPRPPAVADHLRSGWPRCLLVIRLVQRSTVQFVINSMIGIAIAAIFALRSGRAEDAFLPGPDLQRRLRRRADRARSLLRWPLLGFLIGSVTGDPTAWHKDKQLVALCSKLTWILAIPCVLRVLVQYPLWATASGGLARHRQARDGLAASACGAGRDGLGAQPRPDRDHGQKST